MAEFDYKLQHIPGKDNVVADALSRRADLAAVRVSAKSAPRGILKKRVAFGTGTTRLFTTNPFEALAAAGARPPEPVVRRAAYKAVRTLRPVRKGEGMPQAAASRARDCHFEAVLAMVLASASSRELRQTPARRSALAAKAEQSWPERGGAQQQCRHQW